MVLYFAPLEGVTDEIYRRAHFDLFKGVSKYFIPFISPTQHMTFSSREQRSIAPEYNAGIPAVPQVLTKDAGHFLMMAEHLMNLGYKEVNLNLGCPSGTVTAKGKGSGLLRDLDTLKLFLDEIYARVPLPVSIKTRIGFESADEWPRLFEVFMDYPISELIVHPRTRQQFYKGNPHESLFRPVSEQEEIPSVYNGDLFLESDCRRIMSLYPKTKALMLGRGLIANPMLAETLSGGRKLTIESLRAFHERLFRDYMDIWPKNAIPGHMNEMMYYMGSCFENASKHLKAIRKSSSVEAYREAAERLFSECALRENPGFTAPDA